MCILADPEGDQWQLKKQKEKKRKKDQHLKYTLLLPPFQLNRNRCNFFRGWGCDKIFIMIL